MFIVVVVGDSVGTGGYGNGCEVIRLMLLVLVSLMVR